MKLAGRVGWVGGVASLALLAAGALAIERTREHGVTPELRLVAAPEDVELTWGAAPARPIGVRGRPDIARERSPELPPWFGLATAAPVRIAGHVLGGAYPTTIRIAIDVPDPGIWTGRKLVVGADGAFDFGPMRPGRYVLVAAGYRLRSHVTSIDTTQASGDAVELRVAPCRWFTGAVEQARTERWGEREPARDAAIEVAGASIGTTDHDGRFAVCAADEDDLQIRVAGFAVTRWQGEIGWRQRELPAEILLDEVQTGTVFEADGAPAANVGVQPIWGSLLDPLACVESSVVVTTDRDGRFLYVGDRRICGLRIYRGTTMYEAPFGERPRSALPPAPPPPPPWHDPPAPLLPPAGPVLSVAPIAISRGARAHLIVRLRDPQREPAAGFGAARAGIHGARGTWLHGRVVHDGAPVGGAIFDVVHGRGMTARPWVRATVRRDGSFDAFLSVEDNDGRVIVDVVDSARGWQGRALVDASSGPAERDLTIEIGAGLTVRGTLVDERGLPVPGVYVGLGHEFPGPADQPTAADGSFALRVALSGRYRMCAFRGGAGFELLPGQLAPAIDVDAPTGERTGVRVVVHRVPVAGADPGDDCADESFAGSVNLGVALDDHGVVVRIGDEAFAAGMRLGDRVLSIEPRRADESLAETFASVWPGAELSWQVQRGATTLSFHARAPLLGSPR
jgi:hypothetical protein